MNARLGARAPATRSELVSIAERIASIRLLRAGMAGVVLASGVLAPRIRGVSVGVLAAVTGAYLLLALPDPTRHLRRDRLLPVIGGTLLLDGIYLGWVAYATGGAGSPLRFLVYLHIVAVTLLSSYRTGLKIAAWHSLLYLVASYAQSAGLIVVRETVLTVLPGRGNDFQLVTTLHMAALWTVALGTSAFAATSERELRAQKVDLEQLSAMVSVIDEAPGPVDIPAALLDRLCLVFGFTRGVVLVAPEADLELVAQRGGPAPPPVIAPGMDPIMERAWNDRETVLVKSSDAATDPRVAALLPGGRNLLIVPLFLDAGQRLGVMVLEHPGRVDYVKRWVVLMVEQFASHAALALHNAWLVAELRQRLDENRALRGELLSQNFALEATVEDRTKELRESLEDLRMMDEQRRRLMTRLVNAEEEERRRIAGQIHDGPIQEIVVAGMKLERLKLRLSDPEELAMADTIWNAVSRSVSGLRDLLSELRPAVLDEEGLEPAIRQYLGDSDVEFRFEVANRFRHEPSAHTRITLYRIAQEALANVRKHAHASTVEITLDERDEGFAVRIKDDGAGFSPPDVLRSAPGHLGLTSMRERAEMAGGRCQVRGLPGGGTTVDCWIPADAPRRPTGPAASNAGRADPAPPEGTDLTAVSA